MQTRSATRRDTGQVRNGQYSDITATLHAVVENLDGYIWAIDKNRHYLVTNSQLRKKVKDITGIDILPGVHVVDITRLLTATPIPDWEEIYQTGFNGIPQQFTWEFEIQDQPAYFEIVITPIQDEGKITALTCFLKEVTERKRTEDALQQSELRFRDITERKKAEEREITRATIDAQEKERETLGRELHDNVTQILSTAKLCLQCAKEHPSQQADMLQRSTDYITTAIEELRRLSKSMIENFHREVGLQLSVHDLIENIQLVRKCHIKLDYDVPGEQQLDDTLKTTIFRIIQEQLNNILKHADASEIDLSIVRHDHLLQVHIEDNGKGFDTSLKRKGIGITNMMTRAELFNGRIRINASPGQGCQLQAVFNIP